MLRKASGKRKASLSLHKGLDGAGGQICGPTCSLRKASGKRKESLLLHKGLVIRLVAAIRASLSLSRLVAEIRASLLLHKAGVAERRGSRVYGIAFL